MIEKLKKIGGNEWVKNDYHRIYFDLNVTTELVGLKLDFYKTGNISCAWLDGEQISNSQAKRIIRAIDGKFWYDVKSEQFMQKGVDGGWAKRIKHAIQEKLGAE
jgi:hypothetical protein